MSFNSDMKSELCATSFVCKNCAAAECLGMMLFASKFAPDCVRLCSLIPGVRRRAVSVSQAALGVSLMQDGNNLFLTAPADIKKAFSIFGYENKLQLNRALVEEDCCRAAFLRGVLLIGGTVSEPEKGYHLEISTAHYYVAQQTVSLLSEMGFAVGYLQRRGNHILYFKDSSVIEDILTCAGSASSAMRIMLKKVDRELTNNVNRRINCDTANLDKTVDAAGKHIAAIRALEACGKLSELSAPLRETAALRIENPELSLKDLALLHTPPISRPGLNNRLRRLLVLAAEEKS